MANLGGRVERRPVILDPTGQPAQRKLIKTPVLDLKDDEGNVVEHLYGAWPAQLFYHGVTTPNFLLEGERGTGKSTVMRWDAHLKSLSYPGYKYLVLRRTMPELRKSHLHPSLMPAEMLKLGGFFHKGESTAYYPNGSTGVYGHCETEADIDKYLSAEYYLMIFDEIVTFEWDMITRIKASCRVPDNSGLVAMMRGGTNPLGKSADEVHRYFIARDITAVEDPEYFRDDWSSLHMTMDDNPSLDKAQYLKSLAGLPEAYRKAWVLGEWGVEGAYFTIKPSNQTKVLERIVAFNKAANFLSWPWVNVYRIFDFGWHDPSVCLWVAVLPNGREVPFREQSWVHTPIDEIVQDIKELSAEYRIITTFADPTIWDGEKEMGHSIADEMENRGIPLTKAKNDRTAAGLAIQNHLNTKLKDGFPQLVIYDPDQDSDYNEAGLGCPTLVKTLRAMRVDKKRRGRIADHKMDHLPICLGYFCMAGVPPTIVPNTPNLPRWMQRKSIRRVLGREGVRRAS